jgi:hypothetical protein
MCYTKLLDGLLSYGTLCFWQVQWNVWHRMTLSFDVDLPLLHCSLVDAIVGYALDAPGPHCLLAPNCGRGCS